jgi:predicted polyphosphate/ATP-dependent NAD kinase
MGGRVGLKGTNGAEIVAKARELNAKPVSPARAVEALRVLKRGDLKFELITYPHEMGEDEAREAGFDPEVVGKIKSGFTTAEDTKRAVRELSKLGAELVLITGGDGTMGDASSTEVKTPLLGIPAGVKMYSDAFANTPGAAGEIVRKFLLEGLPLREAEVMDIDEEAYRQNRLVAKLTGHVRVPYEPSLLQSGKEGSPTDEAEDQKAIARWVAELMEKERIYILGPGTTTRTVAEELGIRGSTLLGVDLIENRKLLAKDVSEVDILRAVQKKPATIIVSPIGKQGFILGRGNQQLSLEVVKKVGKKNIMVLATPYKLSITPVLKVDTGDKRLDEQLEGYLRVFTGYRRTQMVKVV